MTSTAPKISIDKHQVARQFSRAAEGYDNAASLQQRMSDNLIQMLTEYANADSVQSIIDLGCGTGASLDKLSHTYPNASLRGIDISRSMLDIARKRVVDGDFVCADIEQYAPEKKYDLYFSNASLQWCDFQKVTKNVHRNLNKDGLFAFTSFAPKTHQEIFSSWSKVDDLPHRIDFLSFDEHLEILGDKGFQLLESQIECHQITFSSVEHLLKSIKMTGATNAVYTRAKGLLSRERYQRFIHELTQLKPLCLSYEVVYFILKK